MEHLRQVSDDIAHDLRAPLGRLRLKLEAALADGMRPDDYRAAIDRGIANVDSILETSAALLRIAQIESGVREWHLLWPFRHRGRR